MKCLEVIKLRSTEKGPELLEELLRSVDKFSQSGLVEMRTYRHAALETDLSVHLLWDSERPGQNGSDLGLRLAQALKEFGLVDHSVWLEGEKSTTFYRKTTDEIAGIALLRARKGGKK